MEGRMEGRSGIIVSAEREGEEKDERRRTCTYTMKTIGYTYYHNNMKEEGKDGVNENAGNG